MNIYESEHIYLKKASMDDTAAMYQNVWSDRDISKYMNFKPIDNLDDAKIMIQQSIEYQKSNMGFLVYDKETDEAIGFAGVKNVSDSDYAESGLCIVRKCQGKGYGKELLLLLLSIVFDELHGDKFIYAAMKENTVSINLCRSCGFVYDSSKKVIRKWDNYEYVSEIYTLTAKQYYKQVKKLKCS